MDELGIEMIVAYSPEAKGRVERLLGTFQDRLVKELREAGACTQDVSLFRENVTVSVQRKCHLVLSAFDDTV
jgi:hypothetical protein